MDKASNLKVVLLDVQKVTVALDGPVSKLDPLRLAASLLKEINNTVIVGDVDRSFASQKKVGDLVDLRKLAGGLNLEIAVTVGEGLVSN